MAKKEKSPWSVDASDGATQHTYEIRTVGDFFQVPEERRRICLREFHSWMVIQEGVTALLVAAGASLDTAITTNQLHWENSVFRWMDDGKACISVVMTVAKAAESDPVPGETPRPPDR